MAERADVIVVGGGVIGASVAHHLVAAGLRVVLCERGGLGGGATGRSAGLVRMHHTNRADARLAALGFRTFERWPELVGGDCGFRRTGFLMVVGPEHADALEANVKWLRDLGVDTAVLGPAELAELQPQCSTEGVGAAAYEPRSGYADPARTTLGFVRAAAGRSLRLATGTEVTAVETHSGRVTGVRTSTGTIAAPQVVVAASAWAVGLLAGVGVTVPLRTKQISVCVLDPGPAPELAACCTYIDDTAGTYFRPHAGGAVLVGVPTDRWDLGLDTEPPPPSVPETEAARARAARRLGALRDAALLERTSGLDSYTPDRHPLIGPAPELDGLYLALGFSGGGFKMAPAVGQAVAAELTGGPPRQELEPYRPRRTGAGDPFRQEHHYQNM